MTIASEPYVPTASRAVLVRLRSVLAFALTGIAVTSGFVLLLLRSELAAHGGRVAGLAHEAPLGFALVRELPLALGVAIVVGLRLTWVFLCRPALQLALEATASLEQAQAMARLGSWSYDVVSGRLEWSPQIYAIFGRDPRLGTPSLSEAVELYAEEDARRLEQAVDRAVTHGEGYALDLRLRAPRNGIRVLRAEGRTMRDENGRTTRLFGTVIDVTAAVEREGALQVAQSHAESANQAKSEFLANMSHEIRTPMTAILGYVDLLGDESSSPGEQRQYVSTIKRSADHLLQIINDILDVSKIDAGQMTIERIACSPAAVARDVVALFKPQAEEKGLVLGLRFEGPIPSRIDSDPTRLRQILANLVGNAVKFTESGSVGVSVALEGEPGSTVLRFDVKDSGIGIAPAEQQKLFRPFSQADGSTTRRFGGSGLGLNIANRLAMMLGGGIAVASVPRLGSIFTARIATGDLEGVPLEEVAGEAPTASWPPPASVVAAERPLEGLHVLVAEDGRDNQRLVSLHLRRAGAVVEVAENGQLAVDRLLHAPHLPPIDLVLMDMQMPVLDGYAATARLRSAAYAGPIIGLTAHAMLGDREKCLAAGCNDYVTKPLDVAALFAAIARHRGVRPALDAPLRFSYVPPSISAPISLVPGRISLVPSSVGVRVSMSPPSSAEISYSELEDDLDMADLVASFVDELPVRVAKLEESWRSQDVATLTSLAHQLKGAGGGYGFPRITREAAVVERLAREGNDLVALGEAVASLVRTCRGSRVRRASPVALVAG